MARKQASGGNGGRRGGSGRKNSDCLDNKRTGVKLGNDFTTSAKRALALRRLWLFLVTAALVLIGLASVVRARFF